MYKPESTWLISRKKECHDWHYVLSNRVKHVPGNKLLHQPLSAKTFVFSSYRHAWHSVYWKAEIKMFSMSSTGFSRSHQEAVHKSSYDGYKSPLEGKLVEDLEGLEPQGAQ